MFRRISWITLLAIGTALFAMPGTVAAASPYQVRVKIDHCQFSGGAHGRGYMELKVRARELGKSGTNFFVVNSEIQASSGVGFSTQSTWPKETSNKFPNDSTNYFHVTDRRYDFTKNDEVAFRIVITVKFKNNAGHTLATRTITGKTC